MDNEKLKILESDELLEFYVNFSDLHISKDFLTFESKFSIDYEKPKPPINYIDHELFKAFSEIKPKFLKILKSRLLDKTTLQETGKIYSLTRERVRQIENMSVLKLSALINKDIIIETLSNILRKSILYIDELPIENQELRLLYCEILSHPQSKVKVIFDKELMALVEEREYSFRGIISKIEDTFQKGGKSLFYEIDLMDYLQAVFPKFSNIENLINILIEKGILIKLNDKEYFFHYLYQSKKPMIEFVFSLYPKGIDLYKDIDFIKNELDKYFPNVFTQEDKERRIATAVGNSENIFLWDWGKYIHIDYINLILEEYDFNKILKYIDSYLKDTQIDLEFCFKEFKKELLNIEIENKFALYTCLKLKFPDDYSYHKAPWISKPGMEKKSLTETLLNLMTEDRIYSLDELVSYMKTKKLRVQQLIEYSIDVIAVDTFRYKNRRFIKLPDSLITQLVQYANSKVLGLEFFYVELISNAFAEKLDEYTEYDINTVILELLKKYTQDTNFNVSNNRIVNKDYLITKDSLNFHTLINNLLSSRDTLSINDISNYFSRRGLSPKLITAYFTQSKIKMIVRLDRETYTSIGKIGIENNNIEDMNLLMENIIDSETYIEDLLNTVKLPKISVEWNRYIFTDLIFNDKFSFSPNRENPRYIHKKQ